MVEEFPVKSKIEGSKIEGAGYFMQITDKICNDEPAADVMFPCILSGNRYSSRRLVVDGLLLF